MKPELWVERRRGADIVRERLDSIKVDRHLYDHLVTSGEETHRHLKTRPNAWYRRLGTKAIDTGPARLHFHGQDYLLHDAAFTLGAQAGCSLVFPADEEPLFEPYYDY